MPKPATKKLTRIEKLIFEFSTKLRLADDFYNKINAMSTTH